MAVSHPQIWRVFRICCIALIALPVLFRGIHANAAICARPAEIVALNERVVQTHLMVAALSCNERARYGAFIRKFHSELVARGHTLSLMFDRAYGSGAQTHLNSFITSLANDVSVRSHNTGQFCTEAATLFTTLDTTKPDLLSDLAAKQTYSDMHGIAPCQQRQASKANGK